MRGRFEPPRPPCHPSRVTPEINVTPLVDVVLVLLIIFLVITPQLVGLSVELPGMVHPDQGTRHQLAPATLSVLVDGRLLLEQVALPEADLPAALIRLHREQPDRRLVLEADRRIRYGRARQLFRQAQQAGFPGVALRVNQRAPDP